VLHQQPESIINNSPPFRETTGRRITEMADDVEDHLVDGLDGGRSESCWLGRRFEWREQWIALFRCGVEKSKSVSRLTVRVTLRQAGPDLAAFLKSACTWFHRSKMRCSLKVTSFSCTSHSVTNCSQPNRRSREVTGKRYYGNSSKCNGNIWVYASRQDLA